MAETEDTIEVWKAVVGYEGTYAVSSLGRVRRVQLSKGAYGKILKGHRNKDGYIQVILCKEGKPVMRYVHRLVLEAFHGTKPHVWNMQTRHLNGIPWDNRAANVCWGTGVENAEDWQCIRRLRQKSLA